MKNILEKRQDMETYLRSLCTHLRVDYDSVFVNRRGGYFKKPQYWVRYLFVMKFAGVCSQRAIADFLKMREDSVSRLKSNFGFALANDLEFRKAANYLEELGVIELPKPPRTKELSEKLDLTLSQIDRTIAMLQKQKDEIYEIKKSLPQIWN